MSFNNHLVRKLLRAFPQANIEPVMDGSIRITLPGDDTPLRVKGAFHTAYGWRLLRKVMVQRIAKLKAGETPCQT